MFERIRLRAKFLRFIRQPARTDLIFDMVQLSIQLPENDAAVAELESRALGNSLFRKQWEARWRPPAQTIDSLFAMPAGSLGHAYGDHLNANRLDPNFFRAPAVTRPADYVSLRLYQTHDLWHVLLGYDISPAGELCIQAFTLAQLGTPVSALLIAGGMMNVLIHNAQHSEALFAAMSRAFERGSKSGFLLGFPLEEMLSSSLRDVCSHVGLAVAA